MTEPGFPERGAALGADAHGGLAAVGVTDPLPPPGGGLGRAGRDTALRLAVVVVVLAGTPPQD